jgi:hypothetical protein
MLTNRRSLALAIALASAALAPGLMHCGSSTPEDEEVSEDDVVGINNVLGLGVRYDEKTGTAQATLAKPLEEGAELRLRLRIGKMTTTSQRELNCDALPKLTSAPVTEGTKVVYQAGKVEKAYFDLLKLFDDPNWATGNVSAAQKNAAKNPDPIVEACVVKNGTVKGKIQVNLAYAYDTGIGDAAELKGRGGGLGLQEEENEQRAAAVRITEENVTSQIEYGQLCERELGDIPFFPRIRGKKYETFDCRTLLANGRDDKSPHTVNGVEGAMIPVHVNGVEQDKCSPGRELLDANGDSDYACMDKADRGMYLASGGTQPGPMVVTAKNSKGTHWVLLCRKIADDGNGMTKSKVFTDIAMLGHNPRTGRTCFFQNSIGSGKDGSRVPHPGDPDRSTSIWSSSVQTYCSGGCHSADPFVHSKWIDGAKRKDGTPVVPRMGLHPDFPISRLDSPYNIVAADKLGFRVPKVLISEKADACTNCHRLGGSNMLGDFTQWSTGTGEGYYSKITDLGKTFKESHWMPLNLDGLTEQNFGTSRYGEALKHIELCRSNPSNPECEWGDTPRGSHQNPKTSSE